MITRSGQADSCGAPEPPIRPSASTPSTGRLRQLAPDELTPEQRAIYDEVTTGPRSSGPQHFRLITDDGRLEGPFNGFLLQQALGMRLEALGAAIRYETGLTDRCREIAILVVAAVWHSGFERHAHEPIARAAGLGEPQLVAIHAGRSADTARNWPDRAEHTTVRVTRSLAEIGDLDDELYREAVEVLGETGLFEVITVVGYYAALAMQLRVFRVPAPRPDHSRPDAGTAPAPSAQASATSPDTGTNEETEP